MYYIYFRGRGIFFFAPSRRGGGWEVFRNPQPLWKSLNINFKKASGQKDNSFRISVNHLYMVTLLKKQDPRLAHLSLVSIFKMVMSTAKSMHMTISK